MYTEYFGLIESPFSIAPDPQYLYLTANHREALAHLLYGVGDQGGFVVLTGEVGTGKTTICRSLLQQVPEQADIAFVVNPRQSVNQLLQSVFSELGIAYTAAMTSKDMIDQLNDYLLAAHARGRNTVLIIDEAQNLSDDILEQLRLLTNLETNKKKLLQLVLLGQPELNEILAKPSLRQLSQRVTARYHLPPLKAGEVAEYIEHRLSVAHCDAQVFTPAAIKKIYRLSGGIPRLINLICDRAMLGVYANNGDWVTPKIAAKAAREVLPPALKRGNSIVLTVALVLSVVIVIVAVWMPKAPPVTLVPAAGQLPSAFDNEQLALDGLLHGFSMPGNTGQTCQGLSSKGVYCDRNQQIVKRSGSAAPAVVSLIAADQPVHYLLLPAEGGNPSAELLLAGVDNEPIPVELANNGTHLAVAGGLFPVRSYLRLSPVSSGQAMPLQAGQPLKDLPWLRQLLSQHNSAASEFQVETAYLPVAAVGRSKIRHLYSYRLDLDPHPQAFYDRRLQQAVVTLKQQYGLSAGSDIDHAFIDRLLNATFSAQLPFSTGNG